MKLGSAAGMLLFLLATSCGEVPATTASASPPAAKTAPAASPRATAIATFLRAWSELVPKLGPDRAAWAKNIDDLVKSASPPFEVRVEKCRDRRAFIRKNISMIDKLVLSGDLEKLDRDGDCAVLFVAGGMKQETEFVLDERATTVLFAWIVPEG